MRYKARFQPSELACPETWQWFSTDYTKAILDKVKTAKT